MIKGTVHGMNVCRSRLHQVDNAEFSHGMKMDKARCPVVLSVAVGLLIGKSRFSEQI
jgi:hypothetical protein